MAVENVKNLEKFFAKKIDGIDLEGENCIQEFWEWYRGNDVRLLLPPYINFRKKTLNAIFIPLKDVRRAVFQAKSREKVREKVEKWKKTECGKKSCIHDEWYASFPSDLSADEHIFVATVFYE